MSAPESSHLIRLLARSPFALDIAAFLVDRRSRGLSPRTVQFYRDELSYLRAFLEANDVGDVQDITPGHLRCYLVDLGGTRNPGGVHAGYRAMKVFLRWWERETEPQDWSNPIGKVQPPKRSQELLEPVSLSDLKAILATCERRMFTGDRDRALLYTLLGTSGVPQKLYQSDVCFV